MKKTELVELIFDEGQVSETRVGVERALDAFLSQLGRGIKNWRKVQLQGFGSFEVRKRKARTGRNPRTGEPMQIGSSKTVHFKPGEGLRQIL
ncbi:MAG TPA: HU family DNA-binding protein [Planctomycetota bacterium]|nr:HU family DNA-binding protein [Planctomycetota bacterium]